jgi:Family of unknown function (DUF5765)
MCWSGQASLTVAAVGVSGTLWARSKGSPTGRWTTVLYFTAMELLQAATYLVIDECGLPTNQWLTRLSYAHIAFQPFFINILAMSFIPAEKAKKIRSLVFLICGIGAATMLSKLYVPSPAWACDASIVPLCGTNTCSYHGDWHIAWRLYLNAADSSFLCYFLPAFFLPLFYGSWRWTLYHAFVGPLPAFFMTSNKDEMPAIWCLTSIGFLLALHIRPVEHWMEKPLRAPSLALSRSSWPAKDLSVGFGGASLMVALYPIIRWSGHSEIFNWPAICALFVSFAGAFLFFLWWSLRAAKQARGASLKEDAVST